MSFNRYKTLLRNELIYLWSDLAEARRVSQAVPPRRSLREENLIERIKLISRAVGPVSWSNVEIPMLDGYYQDVCALLEYPVNPAAYDCWLEYSSRLRNS